MDCPKCKTQVLLKRKNTIGFLIEDVLLERDNVIFHRFHCSECDYKTPTHSQIVGTKRWNEVYNQLKPHFT